VTKQSASPAAKTATAPGSNNNSRGRLAKPTDGSGSSAHVYDQQGRVTEKNQTVTLASGREAGTTKYAYDAAG